MLRRFLYRSWVVLLITALLTFAGGAAAKAESTPSPTKTTIVRIDDDHNGGGINTTTLLESAISGIVALGGVAIGVGANRKIERRKVTREERASHIAHLDALIDRVTAVTNRLPTFASGHAQDADILGLQADIAAVRDARTRVQDENVRGAVDVFSAAVQSIIREPRPGPALSDQVKAATNAADMAKARSENAKEALRAENTSPRKRHAKSKMA